MWNEWWALWRQLAPTLVISDGARNVMQQVAERFAAAAFPNPWQWDIDVGELGGFVEELVALELVARGEVRGRFHLTDRGRSWIFDHLGLVVAFCPKCSTDEMMPRGQSAAQAQCRVCGVGWTEDTTVDPFVTKY